MATGYTIYIENGKLLTVKIFYYYALKKMIL